MRNKNLIGKTAKIRSEDDAQIFIAKHTVNKNLYDIVGKNLFEITKTSRDNSGNVGITEIKFNNKVYNSPSGHNGSYQFLISSSEMKYFSFDSREIDRLLSGEQINSVRMINDNTVIIVRDNEIVNFVIPDELLTIMKSTS